MASAMKSIVKGTFKLDVGDRFSETLHSDTQPFEVIAVSKSGKRITARKMKAEVDPTWKPDIIPGGFGGHCINQHDQKWIITSNPDGDVVEFSLRRIKYNDVEYHQHQYYNVWKRKGVKAKERGFHVTQGARYFYDYNF